MTSRPHRDPYALSALGNLIGFPPGPVAQAITFRAFGAPKLKFDTASAGVGLVSVTMPACASRTLGGSTVRIDSAVPLALARGQFEAVARPTGVPARAARVGWSIGRAQVLNVRRSERRHMKLKRAIVLGLLMIFSVVGLAMGGQNDNRRRDRQDNSNRHRMDRRESRRDRGNTTWRRGRHRRRHRRRGGNMNM